MRIKQLFNNQEEHLDYVWSLMNVKDDGIWNKEDLPKLAPFFKYSEIHPRERVMNEDEKASFDFYQKCSAEYADKRLEILNGVNGFEIDEIAEYFGLTPLEMSCYDTDENGNDIDEDGNIMPPVSRETITISEEFLEEYNYPLIMVGAIDSGWDRCGDFKMAYLDCVSIDDFKE
jgi:hypothetical protein